MTTDQFDNNNNGKVREITQDRRNASSNMGRKQESASLYFDFDSKRAEPDGLDFNFENKPDAPIQEKAAEAVPPETPVNETPVSEDITEIPAPETHKKTVWTA